MYDTAKKSRAANKAKAERLANRPLERVDSSDWTPPPLLNADVKTGMRPVSKQALKRGGKVHGEKAKVRADRVARKAGGRVEEKGEQPLVDRYINRDLKKANEYRDGIKHDGALKRGGRAKKADGGAKNSDQYGPTGKWDESKEKWVKKPKKIYPKNWSSADEIGPMSPSEHDNPDKFRPGEMKRGGAAKEKWIQKAIKKPGALHKQLGVKEGEKIPAKKLEAASEKGGKLGKRARLAKTLRAMHKDGGRTKKMDGGPMGGDPRLNIVKPKAMEFGQNTVVPGLKKGGRTHKDSGGGLSQAAYKAMLDQQEAQQKEQNRQMYESLKNNSGGQNQASGLKKGGRAAKAFGGPMMGSAPQMPAQAMANAQGRPFQGGQFTPPGLANQQPMGDVSTQVMPSIAAGAPAAMPSMPPQAAGAAMNALAGARPFARAVGGRTKGKTNINIVIAQTPKEGADQGAMPPAPPAGGPPQGIPVPVPPAGGAPASGPMGGPPMPPPPMGAPRPTPFKKGGRVSKVAHSYKDMTAGAGSGEGRLQKTDIAERMPKKAGGKVYRSYKDMDAGAGSGFGRLEKTEIQSKKSRKG